MLCLQDTYAQLLHDCHGKSTSKIQQVKALASAAAWHAVLLMWLGPTSTGQDLPFMQEHS